jgi:hypothetical protein
MSKPFSVTVVPMVHCDYQALIKVTTDPQYPLFDLLGPTVPSTEHQSAFHHARNHWRLPKMGKNTDYHSDYHS